MSATGIIRFPLQKAADAGRMGADGEARAYLGAPPPPRCTCFDVSAARRPFLAVDPCPVHPE